jgi:phosphate-selective porin OprO/OprP
MTTAFSTPARGSADEAILRAVYEVRYMSTIRRIAGAALIGGLLTAGTCPATAQSETPTLQDLDQKIRVLERKLEIADEEAAKKKAENPVLTAGKEGFILSSSDKAYQLKLRGCVQVDGRFYLDDEDDKAADTFLLRRARAIFDATFGKSFEFRLIPDFGDGKAQLQDGYVDYKPTPLVGLRAGRTKVPFGLERLQSTADTLLNETALSTALTPNYDLGVLLQGSFATGVLDYAVGVFNGGPDGASVDSDTNDAKDYVARLLLTPFRNTDIGLLSGLSVGIGATVGDQEGSATAPGLPTYKTSGQQTFFSYRTSTNADDVAYADGERTRLAPQLYYAAASLSVLGEYILSEQDVANAKGSASLKNDGSQVAVTYVLTGERPSLRGVTPLLPFDPAKGNWGAFELVTRYSELNIDDDAFTGKFADAKKAAAGAQSTGFGLNWYLTRNAKFAINYEETTFDGGATDGDRPDEQVILTRLQIAY